MVPYVVNFFLLHLLFLAWPLLILMKPKISLAIISVISCLDHLGFMAKQKQKQKQKNPLHLSISLFLFFFLPGTVKFFFSIYT